jgi:hypothetical protein
MGVSNVSLSSCVASGRRARTLRSPCAAFRATLHTILEAALEVALGSAALQTTLGSAALQTTLGSPALQAALDATLDATLGSASLETALDLSECGGRRCQNCGREDDPFTQHEALPFWAYPGLAAAIPSPKRRPTDGTATYFSSFTGSVSMWPPFATHFLK